MISKTMYIKDARGHLRQWHIEARDLTITITHGLVGGQQQVKEEMVTRGLGGRTLSEQVESRFRSRINEAYKKGYKDSMEEADRSQGTNAMNLVKPMLAQPYPRVRNINFRDAFTQYKYDGHRCLITKKDGKLKAYSRKGQPITSIDHILDNIQLQEGQTVDGELYCHGYKLQTISSWVRREQDASRNLSYHIYDIANRTPYSQRLLALQTLQLGEGVEIVPTARLGAADGLTRRFQDARQRGYEGLILRWGSAPYEAGKRSSSLVKLKETMDSYFPIIDVDVCRDGWGILVCSLPNEKVLRVSAPGTMEDRYHAAEHPEEFIGKQARVEYASLTKDGVPFHPVATLVN